MPEITFTAPKVWSFNQEDVLAGVRAREARRVAKAAEGMGISDVIRAALATVLCVDRQETCINVTTPWGKVTITDIQARRKRGSCEYLGQRVIGMLAIAWTPKR